MSQSEKPDLNKEKKSEQGGSETEAKKIAQFLKSENPIKALEKAVVNKEVSPELFEQFATVLETISDLPIENMANALRILHEELDLISESVFDIFAEALVDLLVEKVEREKVPKLISHIGNSAVALIKKYGPRRDIPANEAAAIGRKVLELEEMDPNAFKSFRMRLGSEVLARAEGKGTLPLSQALAVVDLIFGGDQSRILRHAVQAYATLFRERQFKLQLRDEDDNPLFTITGLRLIRSAYGQWLEKNESFLEPAKISAADKTLSTLDEFLVGVLKRSSPEVAEMIEKRKSIRDKELLIRSRMRKIEEIQQEVIGRLGPSERKQMITRLNEMISQVQEELLFEFGTVQNKPLSVAAEILDRLGQKASFLTHLQAQRDTLERQVAAGIPEEPTLPQPQEREIRKQVYEDEIKDLAIIDQEISQLLAHAELNPSEREKLKNRKYKIGNLLIPEYEALIKREDEK